MDDGQTWTKAVAKLRRATTVGGSQAGEYESAPHVLETEQVRDLDEELAAVVEKRVASTEEAAVGSEKEVVIEILKVAVVADVDRGAGVEKVGDKKIGVEVLGGRQAGKVWVREHGRVLEDDANGELGSELVIPLRANDVIVQGDAALVQVGEAEPEIRIVDAQATAGNGAEFGGRAVASREEWLHANRRGVVDTLSPASVRIKNDLLEGCGAEVKELGVADKVLIVGENRKVARAEEFGLLGVADT